MEWLKVMMPLILVFLGLVGLWITIISLSDGSMFADLRAFTQKIFYPNSIHRKLNVLAANPSLLAQRYETAKDLIRIQGSDGNWNSDKYMLGMYNGMALLQGVYTDVDPEFRTLPDTILPEIKLENRLLDFERRFKDMQAKGLEVPEHIYRDFCRNRVAYLEAIEDVVSEARRWVSSIDVFMYTGKGDNK